MRYLSLFSGIEAASAAWHPMGWKCAAVSEIEPFPCAVLAHHYPDVPNLGDITKFKEWPHLGSVDLVVGGSPCQSFSVAGLRKGMDDPRGNLMLTYLAVIDRVAPRWVVYENVPGLLSSNGGRDFGTLLGGLAELGYGFAYRILDAQFFGVPQRRRRVFLVGYLGDWRPAAAVLFERESLLGHPTPRREAGKRIAATLTRGAESSGKGGYAGRRQEDDVNIVVAPTLSARSKGGGGLGTDFECDGGLIPSIARALTTSNQRIDAETETLLPTTFAIQAGATRENPDSGPDGIGVQADIAYTLEARAEVQAVSIRGRDGGATAELSGDVATALRASQGGGDKLHVLIPFDTTQITSVANRSNPRDGDPCHPLAAGAHAPAVALNWQAGGKQTTLGGGPVSSALVKEQIPGVQIGPAVRRLTPRECERLQGFPDDYTWIIARGKPAADGPRYKALGNSMAVPVMRWIGERIQLVENIMR